MSTYTIGEVAERTGFTASALRYYEGIGLLATTRTDAGYRLYDDRSLARLAFIARAKQLGCSLEEITDLVDIWAGERCGPVQRRFHHLVTGKIGDAQRQVTELTALTGQLQHAAARLSGPATDGPCADHCACLAPPEVAGRGPAPVPVAAEPADVQITCTLTPGALAERMAAWHDVVAHVSTRTRTVDGARRAVFTADLDLSELARLVADEQRCCTFFSFAITVDARGVALEVRAPEEADAIVESLFGAAGSDG